MRMYHFEASNFKLSVWQATMNFTLELLKISKKWGWISDWDKWMDGHNSGLEDCPKQWWKIIPWPPQSACNLVLLWSWVFRSPIWPCLRRRHTPSKRQSREEDQTGESTCAEGLKIDNLMLTLFSEYLNKGHYRHSYGLNLSDPWMVSYSSSATQIQFV